MEFYLHRENHRKKQQTGLLELVNFHYKICSATLISHILCLYCLQYSNRTSVALNLHVLTHSVPVFNARSVHGAPDTIMTGLDPQNPCQFARQPLALNLTKSSTLHTYLLIYLLHGAESFLRS